ncbi:molecular chaperone [Vibrio gallaecicus]|uniref:fimbrial biogenesis chaperone n=1 Tax=Vibrio gallaecicus TaxID=552386 RepID=UPI0010C978D6|nr:hypothetical protein [Vibrio gallaecicus]MDN3617563.1 hypothetical protein [Vibrio gallaecicus]
MSYIIRILSLITVFNFFIFSVNASVSLSDYRIEFEPSQRLHHLYLFNSSDEAVTYRLNFVDMSMTEDGNLELVDEGDITKNSAAKMLRLSPRQIKIAANGSQTVKILARRVRQSDIGEFRSHLVLTEVPDKKSNDINTALNSDLVKNNEVGIGLKITTSMSIPVFVRLSSSADTVVALNQYTIRQEKQGYALKMQLDRFGDTSVYSDVDILAEASEEPIAKLRNMAFYYPMTERSITLKLNDWDGKTPLKVVFKRHKSDELFFEENLMWSSAYNH